MAPPTGAGGPSAHPVRSRFGRRKFDQQPTQPAGVLVATLGRAVPPAAIRRAVQVSGGDPVAVVTIARIYGSAYGLANPGLMPSKREMAEQRELIRRAVAAVERAGLTAWGQIAASRKPAKTIAQVVRARQSRHVIVISPAQARWRQAIEGDLAKDIARKVGPDVVIEAMTP